MAYGAGLGVSGFVVLGLLAVLVVATVVLSHRRASTRSDRRRRTSHADADAGATASPPDPDQS